METDINTILVFATNIKTENDKLRIGKALDQSKAILQWDIDQEDLDCVLRIETNSLEPNQIIEILNFYQFECKELD